MSTLSATYQEKIVPELAKEFSLKNTLSVPKVEKVVVNIGIGDAKDSREEQAVLIEDLAKITGQKPSVRRARLSIAGFGVREGQPVGLTATLRGKRMYNFLQKLFNIVFPRVRDFRGLSKKSFDKAGNYTLGITEHTVFPEIDLGKVGKVRGIEVTLVTSTRDKKMATRLLESLGMPFEKKEQKNG